MTQIFNAITGYIDYLRPRVAIPIELPQSIVNVDNDSIFTKTAMNMMTNDSKHEFPCPENGNYVTLADCWDCPRSVRCDIYASMLDEDM